MEKVTPKAEDFATSKVIANPTDFFDWADARGVMQIWLDPKYVMKKEVEVAAFLELAYDRGIRVHFLFAATEDDDPASVGLSEIEDIFKLLDKVPMEHWPSALQTNLEHGLKVAWANATTQFLAHVEFAKAIILENRKFGSAVGLAASVSYWWIGFEKGTQPPQVGETDYGWALLNLGCDVTVQNYRLRDRIVDNAKFWSMKASEVGRKAYIGLLSGPDFDPTDAEFAYSEKISEMEEDLALLAKSCIPYPGFGGMAVHDAFYYRKFAP